MEDPCWSVIQNIESPIGEYRTEGKKIRVHWKVGNNTRTDMCGGFARNRAALYQHCCLIAYSFWTSSDRKNGGSLCISLSIKNRERRWFLFTVMTPTTQMPNSSHWPPLHQCSINNYVCQYELAYLSMKGTFNLGGTVSPKKSASSAIFNKTLLIISPKYMPEINFSKICEQQWNNVRVALVN